MDEYESILLSRSEVASLLEVSECIPAVESAFAMLADGKASTSKVVGIHVNDGGFHIKAGSMRFNLNYFVAKSNGNFPLNTTKYNLPTIQGIIIVCNAENGNVLAVMDSIEITIIRTGAATGVAAKYLSRTDSKVATICGCGNQGRISLKALLSVRKIERAFVYDTDFARSKSFAVKMSEELNIEIIPVEELRSAVLQSDICVTCSPSKQPLLFKDYIRPGTFIAAVGADSPEKNEIDSALISGSKLVVDISEQSASIGDLHHALKTGIVNISHIHAELGEIIAGKKAGRENDEEIIVFDSTGTALQDIASAAIVYTKALESNIGLKFNFGT
jgi:ornithine cyclodeaminase/alanine dehydrogenase